MMLATFVAVVSAGAAGPEDLVDGAGASTAGTVPPEVQQTIRDQVGRGEVVALASAASTAGTTSCECGAIAQIDTRSSLNDAPAAVRRMLEDQRGRVIELIRVGPAADLAKGVRAALDAQKAAAKSTHEHGGKR